MSVKGFIAGLVGLLLYCPPNGALGDTMEETQYGFFSDRQMVSARTLLFNEALHRRISEIGDRIVRTAGQPGTNTYTYRILNDPTINAASIASGFVYINTGLLDILESEDELAAVIAHEIAHVHDHHQINFEYAAHRRKVAGQAVGILLGLALGVGGGMAAPTASYSGQLVGLGNQLGLGVGQTMAISMIEGYGEDQELEADAFAIRHTRQAGYDATALVGVFRKLASIKGRLAITKENYVSALINAEPGLEARIEAAQELLAKAE